MKIFLLALIILLFSTNCFAALTYVSESQGHDYSSANDSSIATAALSTTSGNLLVITTGSSTLNASTGAVTSVTDTAGNSYTQVPGCQSCAVGCEDIWYAYNITGNANNVVTVTYSSPNPYVAATQIQFSGEQTSSSPLQLCATGSTASGTSVTTSSFTPNPGNANVVAGNQNGSSTISAVSPYTGLNMNIANTTEYLTGATATSQTASYDGSNTTAYVIAVASFQAAGSSQPTTINKAIINKAILN